MVFSLPVDPSTVSEAKIVKDAVISVEYFSLAPLIISTILRLASQLLVSCIHLLHLNKSAWVLSIVSLLATPFIFQNALKQLFLFSVGLHGMHMIFLISLFIYLYMHNWIT